MRKLTRGAAALLLGSALAASAAAQPPAPPAAPPAAPPGAPPAAPPMTPIVPSVVPMAKAPEVRPTGNAATVNGQAIPEVAVYRALRQFPEAHKEMARKEIMAHLIENAIHSPALIMTCRFGFHRMTDSPSTTAIAPTSGRVSRVWNSTAILPRRRGSGSVSISRSLVVGA